MMSNLAMKSMLILSAAIFTAASAFSLPEGHPLINWQPAGPDDGKYQSQTNLALAD